MGNKEGRLAALENQVGRLERRLGRLRAISERYSWVRLAVFIGGLALVIVAFYLGGIWLGVPTIIVALAGFNLIAWYHGRLEKGIERHKIWLKLKRIQIARMTLDWAGMPPAEFIVARSEHPFQIDLDLTGERSLHQLINTAISVEGSQRLTKWLLTTVPDLTEIERRQTLVQELAPMSLFRGKLSLKTRQASDENKQWEGRRLLDWLHKRISTKSLRPVLLWLSGLAAINILLFGLNFFGIFPNFLWLLTFVIYVGVFQTQSQPTASLLNDAYILRDGLNHLSGVLKYLEKYNYGSHQHVQELCKPFLNQTTRPSSQLKRVTWVATAAILQKNYPLWLVINAFVPWRYYFAHRLNQCKADLVKVLPTWMEVWFELETLNSLAEFTYLNPNYTFAEMGRGEGTRSEERGARNEEREMVVLARGLGHPLIPDEQKVCNDFGLNALGEVIIITGSNMAGKSSFLRTLGVSLCLTYAGGPVNAASFQTELFRLFTCIKVTDSINDGLSYFYAEVKRLKALLNELERADALPLFFLIDEIFRGTNNRERLIGSRSYLRALVGRNGTGVVSTHDLELVKLADEMPQLKNYHFRETVTDGKMVFDYKLRTGPSPTTNALKIMALEGLPVEES